MNTTIRVTGCEGAGPSAARVALAALAALAIAMGVGRFAFTPALPLMQADHGLTVTQGAWLATANYVGYLIGSMGAMWLRAPAPATITAALLAVAAATSAMAWTADFAAWLALRLAAGVASAFALVFVSSWALERLSERGRPELRGVVFSGVGVGIAVSGLAALAIAAMGAGAAATWTALGVGSALLGVAVHGVVSRVPARPPAQARAEAGTGRPGEFWRLVACYGAFGFGYIVPATFLPAMARAQLGDSPLLFGLAWPVFGLAGAASTWLAVRWFRDVPPRSVWIGASAVMAAGLLLPLLGRGMGVLLGSALCVGGTFMVITMAGLQEARRVGGANARACMAAMTAAFALGQIAGPVLVAVMPAGESAFHAAMAAAALTLLASAAALAIAGRPIRDYAQEARDE